MSDDMQNYEEIPLGAYEDALEELAIPDNVVYINKEKPKYREVPNSELPGDKQGTAGGHGDKQEVSTFKFITAGELMRQNIKYDWLITDQG